MEVHISLVENSQLTACTRNRKTPSDREQRSVSSSSSGGNGFFSWHRFPRERFPHARGDGRKALAASRPDDTEPRRYLLPPPPPPPPLLLLRTRRRRRCCCYSNVIAISLGAATVRPTVKLTTLLRAVRDINYVHTRFPGVNRPDSGRVGFNGAKTAVCGRRHKYNRTR